MNTDRITRPAPLREGDLIRVVSPSLPSMAYATRAVDLATDALAGLGWRCDFAENADEISDDGLSAGTPRQRADDLHDAFLDDRVAAVMSAVGGSTSYELLPHLDTELIRSHPKPFIGRSDNTYINAFLLQECGLVSYNGVAFLSQFGEPEQVPETLASTKAVLCGSAPVRFRTSATRTAGVRPWQQYARHEKDPLLRSRRAQDVWMRPGAARGRLVGGEVRIVADLLEKGSLTVRERVLWLDVGDDEPGYFDSAVGRITSALDGPPSALVVSDAPWRGFEGWCEEVEAALLRSPELAQGPVLVGGDCGHYQPAWLLPYGDVVTVGSREGIGYRYRSGQREEPWTA